MSVVDHDHLSAGLVGLHDAMRFADLVEAEDAERPVHGRVEPSGEREDLEGDVGPLRGLGEGVELGA